MKPICFYFQLHESYELKHYNIFNIGFSQEYFDFEKTKEILAKKIYESYLPMNELLLKLFNEHGAKFKVSFSISGITLDLFEKYFPDMLESFQKLAKTGNVEFLAETYYHSLSSLFSEDEFKKQVLMHTEKIEKLFGQTPTTFRNSELLYSNEIGKIISEMGFQTAIAYGWNSVLKMKSSNLIYEAQHNSTSSLKLLLGNPELSMDIEEKFSDSSWMYYPLDSKTYSNWLKEILNKEDIVNLFLDYETFGCYHKKESGIFDFFEHMVKNCILDEIVFETPSYLVQNITPKDSLSIPTTISWTNTFEDAFSWMGNPMQKQSSAELYELSSMVSEINNQEVTQSYRLLTNSNYFYNMCTHLETSEFFHGKFSHHDSPYENYILFMNILRDLSIRIRHCYEETLKQKGTPFNDTSSLEELRALAIK